ncbi:MAG: DegT/DnrJ/EryC1/StrS aminotransferase family protein [Candidatus Omnitrophica bacterium]|nr:DegT/DnrJ/EryC1/StrS aminotransferase family protein [Candidatus Omnitrophota bacterium]MDD5517965.1 DegT/DnrJ/EryC1/StrS aminotransferase family protein [Candidatus Omnitrophota bacterium]
MSLFREIPPTAGLPIYAGELFSAFFKRNQRGSLEEDFKNYLGVPYAAVTYSGTAAFYLILEALKTLSPKKTLVIPSFICPLIPLAIKRAGLKVLVCDINRDNFNFEANQIKELCFRNRDILAIVPVHLAGIPVDVAALQKIARENNFFIIEDCAQSLGALYRDKKTGTSGDFAFFSLCRGKGLTIYEGGVLICKHEFIPAVSAAIKSFVKEDFFSENIKILELFGYWIFYRPLLFWFAFSLPQIFWEIQGKAEKAFIEYFTIDFSLHKVSEIRKRLGQAIFPRLETQISKQRQIASGYISGLKDRKGIKLITEADGDSSNYPYLTLLFDDPAKRDRALHIFKGSGLGLARIYLSAITDYGYLKDIVGDQPCPNARYVARNHITLSTSSFLRPEELDSAIDKLKKI